MSNEEQKATGGKPETQITSVKMTDGRIVDFPGKRNIQKSTFVGDDGTITLRVDFRNGASRLYPLRSDMLNKFAAHGAEQKYGDEIAGLKDVDDMVEAMDELHERLHGAGEWTQQRESSGLAGVSVLARAVAEVKGVEIEKVKAWLKTKTPAEKTALRTKNPAIKAVVDRIEAEKAAKADGVNTEELLSTLG